MKEERYTFEEIYDMLNGRLPPKLRLEQGVHYISEEFRSCIANALTKLPKKIVDWTISNVFFASSTDKPACCLSRSRMEPAKVIIFLSNCLLDKSKREQAFIVAHEIAHFKLHKCIPRGIDEESIKQEKDANELAEKWLGFAYPKPIEMEKEGSDRP
jgi:hypothetical protein